MAGFGSRAGGESHLAIRRAGRREDVVAFGAVLIVLVAAYSNIVFFSESLVYSSNLNLIDPRIRSVTHGPDFRPASTWLERNLIQIPNIQDPGAAWTQWETGGEFFERSLASRDAPFWDPYTGGGVPAMANLTQAFFFPPYLLLIALGNGALLKNVYFLVLLAAAGWCTWKVLRRAGLTWSSSLVGGIVFMLSGGLTQTTGSFIGQTACCLPVALLATQWAVRRATWSAAAVMGVGFAAIALASFPPLLAAVFGFSAWYVAVEIALAQRSVGTSRYVAALRFVVGASLGAALVAFYYIPAAALARATPQVANFYQNASSQTLVRVRDLLQLFAPALMGGAPVWANDPIPHVSPGAFHYLGAVSLVLVGCAGRPCIRRPLFVAAAVAAPITIGIMVGGPPFAQLRELPGIRTIHFGNYYGIVLDFLLALLAAAGFERVVERKLTLSRWAVVTAVIAAGLVAVFGLAASLGVPGHAAYGYWRREYLTTIAFALTGVLLVLAAITARRNQNRTILISVLIVAMIVVEGVTNNRYPRQVRWDAWAHPPEYVQYLQQHAGLGRVFTSQAVLYANSGSAFGIMQLDSLMTFNSPRMFSLYRRYARTSVPIFLRDAEQLPPDPVLDAANITHVATRNTPTSLDLLTSRGHEIVFKDDYAAVTRRTSLPRYFFTGDYTVVPPAAALEAVGRERRAGEIIVEHKPVFVPHRVPSWADVPVKVERLSNQDVRLSLNAPYAGFVYASEAYFSGWHARVNGRTAAIEPANYAFRAVAVPPGPVVLELHYSPPGLRGGLVITALALVFVAAAMISRLRSRYPSSRALPADGAIGSSGAPPITNEGAADNETADRRPRRPPVLPSGIIDASLAAGLYVLAYRLRFRNETLQAFLPQAWSTLPAVVLVQIAALTVAGAYGHRRTVEWLLRVFAGAVVGSALAATLVGAGVGFQGLSRVAFVADAGLLAIAAVTWRAVWTVGARAERRRSISLNGAELVDWTDDLTVRGSVASLYRYRELLKNLVLKDRKLKYRGSVFGFLWSLANPMLMVVVYSVAFTYILGIRTKGFVFYLMLGQLAWSFFATSATMSTGVFVDNAGLLKSVRFPRAILPISAVLFNLAQFLLTAIVFIPMMMLLFRVPPSPPLLVFPILLALQATFSVGVALILATATAFFRDVRHLLDVALAVLFWLTPIVYELARVPHEGIRLLILLSPVSPFIVAYHQVFFYREWPDLTVWVLTMVYAIGAFAAGTALVLAFDDRVMEHL